MKRILLASIVCVLGCNCANGQVCENGTCSLAESALRVATSPIRVVREVAPIVREVASVPVHAVVQTLQHTQQAIQSRPQATPVHCVPVTRTGILQRLRNRLR
jgi:hypothetical protein